MRPHEQAAGKESPAHPALQATELPALIEATDTVGSSGDVVSNTASLLEQYRAAAAAVGSTPSEAVAEQFIVASTALAPETRIEGTAAGCEGTR